MYDSQTLMGRFRSNAPEGFTMLCPEIGFVILQVACTAFYKAKWYYKLLMVLVLIALVSGGVYLSGKMHPVAGLDLPPALESLKEKSTIDLKVYVPASQGLQDKYLIGMRATSASNSAVVVLSGSFAHANAFDEKHMPVMGTAVLTVDRLGQATLSMDTPTEHVATFHGKLKNEAGIIEIE